jgi:8-oxo-dGTP pyrophosphatase MutT (NUDIX family)
VQSFEKFLNYAPKLSHLPLPGLPSQLKMAALERLEELQELGLKSGTAKTAAVMMLLYPVAGETHFVLIERAVSDSAHSGQIAFPGGRMDPEDLNNPMNTAIRETWEEIGVHPQQQEVLVAGTSIYIPPSNYRVFPYLAFAKARPTFTLQLSEVKSILEVPVAGLLNPASATTQVLATSYGNNMEVPCFVLNGQVVWGATAMILMEFRDLLLDTMRDDL